MRILFIILGVLLVTTSAFSASYAGGVLVSDATICENTELVGAQEQKFTIGISGGSSVLSADLYCEGAGGGSPFDGHATLTDDLWAYYTFEAMDGDDSTENHDATPSGTAPTLEASGIHGNCADFTAGSQTYFDISAAASFADWSVSAWVYSPAARGYSGTTITLSSSVSVYLTYVNTSDKPGTYGSTYYTHSTAMSLDAWHHVVWSQESSTGAYYVVLDGNWAGRKYAAGGGIRALQPSKIGCSDSCSATYDFHNFIDEMGIWERVLTQTEIEDLYNGGSGLFY